MAAESIAVYCRVRNSSEEVTLKPPGSLTVRNLGFTMNGVFGDDATQKGVYDASASELVDRVLAGCNSTMLAYGQTGSGKTYTMLGGEKAKANLDKELGEEHGIIPRACKQLFAGIKPGQSIKVSYIEVYNDSINDMLCADYGKEKGQNLPLREVNLVTGGKACVPDGLTLAPAKDAKEVMTHIAKGDMNRVVAAMQMNPRSSRGHGILALHIIGDDKQPYGRLTLCDLAGMESSKKSAAVDTGPSALAVRKEEAKRINVSLLALSSVVSVLASKGASRVPYRDAKLTRILQDSLGGNCKCAIVVTVRCERENVDEAINTLRFAQRAAAITVQVMSNADARANARPKAARLAEELEAARTAMSDFETALAAVEGDKAQLHAEVQALMDEMRLLQRDNERKDEALKSSPGPPMLDSRGSGSGKSSKKLDDPLGRTPMEAVADFEPEDPKEIPFVGGDTVYVFVKKPSPEGWWYAECRGKIGLVPKSFLVETEAPASELEWLRQRVVELEDENRYLKQRDVMQRVYDLAKQNDGAGLEDAGPKLLLASGFNMQALASFEPIMESEGGSRPTSEVVLDSKKKSKLGNAINWGRQGSKKNNSGRGEA